MIKLPIKSIQLGSKAASDSTLKQLTLRGIKFLYFTLKEIVIYKKRTFKNCPPPPIPGIERVTEINIVGVILKNDLSY